MNSLPFFFQTYFMKRILLLLFIIISGRLAAQVDSAAMMKSWMDYMTPGDMHAVLAKLDGEWTADISMWIAPGTEPTKTTGTCVNKMIMGGRYQQATNTADMMGMPFEGSGTTGYDNAKKLFVSTWIDNMGTGIIMMEGSWNATTKTISFKGKTIDPFTKKDMKLRENFQIIDEDTHRMEMYGPDPATGKEYKTMEIIYRRKS